jgi:hypothetical protein
MTADDALQIPGGLESATKELFQELDREGALSKWAELRNALSSGPPNAATNDTTSADGDGKEVSPNGPANATEEEEKEESDTTGNPTGNIKNAPTPSKSPMHTSVESSLSDSGAVVLDLNTTHAAMQHWGNDWPSMTEDQRKSVIVLLRKMYSGEAFVPNGRNIARPRFQLNAHAKSPKALLKWTRLIAMLAAMRRKDDGNSFKYEWLRALRRPLHLDAIAFEQGNGRWVAQCYGGVPQKPIGDIEYRWKC